MKNGSRLLRCCGENCKTKVRVGMGVVAVLCSACSRRGIGDRIAKAVEEANKERVEKRKGVGL